MWPDSSAAMGQRAGIFETWPNQNRLILQDFKFPWDSTCARKTSSDNGKRKHYERGGAERAPASAYYQALRVSEALLWDGYENVTNFFTGTVAV